MAKKRKKKAEKKAKQKAELNQAIQAYIQNAGALSASAAASAANLIPKLLTVHQVADMLGYHWQTIYKWARLDMIPCIRCGRNGRSIRFRLSDIEAWEAEQTTGKL